MAFGLGPWGEQEFPGVKEREDIPGRGNGMCEVMDFRNCYVLGALKGSLCVWLPGGRLLRRGRQGCEYG